MAVTVLDVAQLIGARMQGGTAEQAQVPITEVGLNSAELPAGALFAAVPGTRVHGARFAADTAAAAILTDEAGWGLLSAAGETRPVLVVDDVRGRLWGPVVAAHGDWDYRYVGEDYHELHVGGRVVGGRLSGGADRYDRHAD